MNSLRFSCTRKRESFFGIPAGELHIFTDGDIYDGLHLRIHSEQYSTVKMPSSVFWNFNKAIDNKDYETETFIGRIDN